MEEDRCDNEKEVFNAKVHEDEMIISINEYKELKARIQWQEDCISGRNTEFEKMDREFRRIRQENLQLKQGIINFIKSLGEIDG